MTFKETSINFFTAPQAEWIKALESNSLLRRRVTGEAPRPLPTKRKRSQYRHDQPMIKAILDWVILETKSNLQDAPKVEWYTREQRYERAKKQTLNALLLVAGFGYLENIKRHDSSFGATRMIGVSWGI